MIHWNMARVRGSLLTACVLMLLPYLLYNYKPSNSTILLRRLGIVPKDPNLKYMYQITSPETVPFNYMEKGQQVFIKNKCKYQNCFVTSNEDLLEDVRLFDAVLFHAPDLNTVRLKPARLVTQKFVFVSIESSQYYPVCHPSWDKYFNWTWTYRLDSDLPYPYVMVRDRTGRVVAPARDVTWRPHHTMAPVSPALRDAFGRKSVAAAWLVSSCRVVSKREDFVKKLDMELDRFGLRVDTWGGCGYPTNNTDNFLEQVERAYYFYLAFENSFSDDYVTEKLLHATMHLAVPVVYGGANYSRFLPPHSYLDARALGVVETARLMRDLIADQTQYAEYHRWRSHYSFHYPTESPETDPHCRFCEMMNSDRYQITTVYENFRDWWNGSAPDICV